MRWLMFIALILFYPPLAVAASAGSGVPADIFDGLRAGDIAGDLARNLFAPGGTLYQILEIAGYLAIIAAAVMVLYMLALGTINTARSGEFLGRRDGWWTPFRATIVIMLVMPVPGAGLSIVQYAITTIPEVSIGAASAVWRSVVDRLSTAAPLTPPAIPRDPALASSVLRALTCAYTGATYYGDPREWKAQIDHRRAGRQQITEIKYGRDGRCGSVRYVSHYPATADHSAIRNAMAGAAEQAFFQLHYDLDGIARSIVIRQIDRDYSGLDDAARTVRDATDRFYATITRAGYAAAASNRRSVERALTDRAQRDGWIAAGGFVYGLAQQQAALGDAVRSSIPSITASRATVSADDTLSQIIASHSRTAAAIAARASTTGGGVVVATDDLISNLLGDAMREVSAVIQDSPAPPLVKIRQVGDSLNSAAVALTSTAASTSAASGLLARIPVIGGAVEGGVEIMREIVMSIVPVLVVIGWLFATALPLLPYIIWIVAAGAYFLALLEAALLAPAGIALAALPDGNEDLLGRAGTAVARIASLLLRPMLMLAGLLFGMAVFTGIGQIVDKTIWPAISVLHSASGYTILGFAGSLIAYLIVLVLLSYLSFSTITSLPAALDDWIATRTSSGSDSLAEESAHLGQHAATGVGRLAQGVGRSSLSRGAAGRSLGAADDAGKSLAGGATAGGKIGGAIDDIASRR